MRRKTVLSLQTQGLLSSQGDDWSPGPLYVAFGDGHLADATFEGEDIDEEELRDISGRARFLIRKLYSKYLLEQMFHRGYDKQGSLTQCIKLPCLLILRDPLGTLHPSCGLHVFACIS